MNQLRMVENMMMGNAIETGDTGPTEQYPAPPTFFAVGDGNPSKLSQFWMFALGLGAGVAFTIGVQSSLR
jgi:hypothetical protein